ncbi:MAG: NAD(P)-dependent alcohol dehydrogenase [Azospirillaceae bacterium]
MRLYRLRSGAPDRLVLEDAAEPQPGRGQIVMRIHAVSLNYRDLMVAEGRYAHGSVADGLVPCSDAAGEVIAVGEGVDRVAVGDRVAGLFMGRWLGGPYEERYGASALGGSTDGVLAEQVLFDQEAVVRIPDHLDYAEAATLPCAAVTAWNALFGGTPLLPGESVLVQGTGGVSLFALALARLAGAVVIQTTTSPGKAERARALGADELIVIEPDGDWPQAVLDLTQGRGVDHVVEVVGGANVAGAVRAARNGGAVHLIGAQASGSIDPTAVRRRNIVLRGIYVGSRNHFEAMNRAIARARLRPLIDRSFPLAAAAEAYAHLKAQAHMGKVVIDVSGEAAGRRQADPR